MTEKEKAAAGFLYDANWDPALLAERQYCKNLCLRYNCCPPTKTKRQQALLRKLIPGLGKDAIITAPFYCDYGYNIRAGNSLYMNHNCVVLDAALVTFGDFVFIGPNCCFTTAGHPLDREQRQQGLEIALPITLGSHVWLGANVTVLPGVTIGDGAVIGAGSVVSRDIPPDVVAVGQPCRVLRPITAADREKYRRAEE